MSPVAEIPEDARAGRAVTVLLEIYKENAKDGRHLEFQCQLVTAFVLTVGGGLLAALVKLQFFERYCKGFGTILLVAGLLGTFFSIIQIGRYHQHRARWRAAYERLDLLCPQAELLGVDVASKPENTARQDERIWLWIGQAPLHWLWIFLPFCIAVFGYFLLAGSFTLRY